MANITMRNSVLAILAESTEGTPVFPSGATDYIAMQNGFKLSPSTAVLSNAEVKSSLAPSKNILGSEAPKVSLSHYLRASGTVNTVPNYGLLLKASLGAVATNATEYDTVSSSTTSVINVDTGEGAAFQRGEALLIKDGTNGYRIRVIDSISSDALTIGFQVPSAPASGVNLGKAVLYYPANTGHISLTAVEYVGNAGAVQAVSGCRVTDASFDFKAGELIEGSYSLEGLNFYFDPITITSSTKYIDFTDDTGTFAASVTAQTYKDPQELMTALAAAMNLANPLKAKTVTYSNTTGAVTITSAGAVFTIKWNTGTNTANSIASKLGFSTAADSTSALTYTGSALSWASPYTPSFDSADPLAAKDMEVMLGSVSDYLCFASSSASVKIATPKTNISSMCAVSGISGSIINQRTTKITVQGTIAQYDASKYDSYRTNANVKFQISFGTKSSGNWVAGQCGVIYCPTATITSFEVVDNNGVGDVTLELSAYADSTGQGEIYINFL